MCHSWRDASDIFLSNHQSPKAFDGATYVDEIRKAEYGRKPIWNESPLKKLAKAYVFSDIGVIQQFTSEKRETILELKVCLDNLIFASKSNFTKAAYFLKRHDVHINYLALLYCIDSPIRFLWIV